MYKLVPLEPTEEMIFAAQDLPEPRMFGAVYRAMINKAPEKAVLPEYESIYREKIERLVMRHVDRMGDICEQDTAEQIIESFLKGFQPIFDEYLYAKFPNSYAVFEQQGRIKP